MFVPLRTFIATALFGMAAIATVATAAGLLPASPPASCGCYRFVPL